MAKHELPPEAVAFFRAKAAERQQVEHACAECDTRFTSLTWARYCSKRCKDRAAQRAYRQRQRGQGAAAKAASPPSSTPSPAP